MGGFLHVGAAVGALHGRPGLPRRWLDGLTGWTRLEGGGDEGRMFELLDVARLRFWDAAGAASEARNER
jgi:ADP-ribosyl-[dinitrogen reductase] hydrolase